MASLIDFSVIPMDDYLVLLGMEFMDKVKVVMIPFANAMCILEEGQSYMVPLSRGQTTQGLTLSTLQLSKGIKWGKLTYLMALKGEDKEVKLGVPKEINKVLEDFKDVMPKELPKKLPPKRV